MGVITSCETEHAHADAQALSAEALIIEARAHARRRRLRMAIALVAVAGLAAAGVLIGRAVTTSPAGATVRPGPTARAGATGMVTGHLDACFGVVPAKDPWPVDPGTVLALRGGMTWQPHGPGAWRAVFPSGPAVASQHISNNYDQTFHFALPPGRYVLAGRYDGSGPTYGTFREVTITAGATIRVDLPDTCK